jgi:hypothetical protein
MERRRVGSPIESRDADGHVLRPGLRVLDDHVEVAVVVEDPGVHELELSRLAAPLLVLFHEPRVGVLGLRILVEPLHVGVGGGRVEVVPVLLDVLPVVCLAGHEAEEALLQDGVALVPESEGEAEHLVAIADAGQAVLTPAVGLAARELVGEVVPGGAVGTVVLAHGTPRALGDVRTPAAPGREVPTGQALVLSRRGHALEVGLDA